MPHSHYCHHSHHVHLSYTRWGTMTVGLVYLGSWLVSEPNQSFLLLFWDDANKFLQSLPHGYVCCLLHNCTPSLPNIVSIFNFKPGLACCHYHYHHLISILNSTLPPILKKYQPISWTCIETEKKKKPSSSTSHRIFFSSFK